ncbi:MAG: hypothetical protein K6A28_05925, partial [Bacteroidales bacterium]|nr:hypothetical protein [Bacteroidales bacterium]
MKRIQHRNWLTVALWTFLAILLLFIGLHLFTNFDVAHQLQARRVQKTFVTADRHLSESKDIVSSYLSSTNRFDSLPSIAPNTSCYIFRGNTLVFWNDNIVEPKLLYRRIAVGCDTIAHFNSGDFLISSGRHANYTYYLYTLINSNYSVHNQHFVNKYQLLPGNNKISISPVALEHSYPLVSSTGKTLGYFQLQSNTVLGFHNPNVLAISLLLLVLTVYLLILRRFIGSKTDSTPSAEERDAVTTHELSLSTFVPSLLYLLFFTLSIVGFKALFRLFFQRGLFLPESLSSGFMLLVLTCAFLVFISLLLLLRKAFKCKLRSTSQLWIPMVVCTLLMVVVAVLLHLHWLIVVFGVLIMGLFVVTTCLKQYSDFFSTTLLLVFWAFLFTDLYDQEHIAFENRQIRELAVDLADERDFDFEQSYHQFLSVAQHDTTFFSMVLSEDIMEKVAEDYIRCFLFDSVMNQYNVKLTLCDPGAELVVEPYNLISDCMGYFQDKVNENSGIDLGEGLAFLDYNTLDPSYLSMINILVNDTVTDMSLFLEFSKPLTPQGYGLTRLLQNESHMLPVNASVACYQDTLLVYKYGSYIYPNYLTDFRYASDGFGYGRRMKHFTYHVNDSKILVITVVRRTLLEKTIPFAFFFVGMMLIYLLMYYVGGMNRPIKRTLSRRFQLMMLSFLGLSLLIVGLVSVFYMRNVYKEKSDEFHYERTQTLLQNIVSDVDFAFMNRPGFKYELQRVVNHYSEIFFTDINIYGLDGKLLATNTPEIHDMNLQSSLMDAEAFDHLQGDKYLYYLNVEQLGDASYSSAYISILDRLGNTMAYLNIPYFSVRSGLQSEVLNFILIYSNIILFFALLILFAILFLTRRVTNPLIQLQDKMAQVDITKSNELLDWKSDDEIGTLVKQYNQLVVELEKSAMELRRTTTESAWRSAARQVAHEIKNSLTPMRLRIQM